MRNLKITIAYEGTEYHGWQIQKGYKTLQEALEKALYAIIGEKARVIASGRTDAGVHALGQVAHVHAHSGINVTSLKNGLNHKLPEDICILRIQEVPMSFHARFSAKSKIYSYSIWMGKDLPVFERRLLFHHPGLLDAEKIEKAARILKGHHDFASFGVNPHDDRNIYGSTVRNMTGVIVKRKGFRLTIHLEANGFLYKMVRSIIGTLIEVGEGKITIEEFKRILKGRDRSLAGKTAPAQGLCLLKVKY